VNVYWSFASVAMIPKSLSSVASFGTIVYLIPCGLEPADETVWMSARIVDPVDVSRFTFPDTDVGSHAGALGAYTLTVLVAELISAGFRATIVNA